MTLAAARFMTTGARVSIGVKAPRQPSLVDNGKPRVTWGRKATGLETPPVSRATETGGEPCWLAFLPGRCATAAGIVWPMLFVGALAIGGFASFRPW